MSERDIAIMKAMEVAEREPERILAAEFMAVFEDDIKSLQARWTGRQSTL